MRTTITNSFLNPTQLELLDQLTFPKLSGTKISSHPKSSRWK
jgi:hypothetical protein